jgi:hypothetical protein
MQVEGVAQTCVKGEICPWMVRVRLPVTRSICMPGIRSSNQRLGSRLLCPLAGLVGYNVLVKAQCGLEAYKHSTCPYFS